MVRLLALIITTTVFFGSCRSTRPIQTAIAKKDSVVTPISISNPNAGSDSLSFIRDKFKGLESNKILFNTFSAKVDVDYTDAEGKKYDVNAHIRMFKDSTIWISVTAILGIEGLRALITKDSVKLLDKQNKIYIARSVSYLQEMTQLPLDLQSLQGLLIGNPVFLDSNILSYNMGENTVSLLSIGTFFKHLLTIDQADNTIVSSKLDDRDPSRNRTCHLTYSNYENKKGMRFPSKRTINVSEKKKIDIKLDFKQYDFNETLSFPFNIPKNYKLN